MIDYKELEKAYKDAMQGGDEPNILLLPEGVFMRESDGRVEVYSFDSGGNWRQISPEEQLERIGKVCERLGIQGLSS